MQCMSTFRASVRLHGPAFAGRLLRTVLSGAVAVGSASAPGVWVLGISEARAQDGPDVPSAQVTSGYIDVDGGRVFYEETGRGDCIVLVHDGLIHGEIWNAQFPVLGQTHRVVRYDRRGYGRSDPPQSRYSNTADLDSVFVQLGIDQAWLIGMSAGGGLCIDFALAHPEKVTGLVLVGAVVSGFDYTPHMYTRGGRLTPAVYADPEALRHYMVTTDPYEMAPSNTAARAKAAAFLDANPGNVDPEKHRLAVPPEAPALGRLGEIRVPTLIVIGEHDIPDVHAHAGAIDAGIPDAQRVVVSDAGHLVPLEQPEVFTTQVQTFLKEAHFFQTLASEGATAAAAEFERYRQAHPGDAPFTEQRLNLEGYRRLQSGRVNEAIELFKLNVQAYPGSWNTHDSLAEGYMTRGDVPLAIASFEKSLELNPDNVNARQRIEELRQRR